MKRNILLLMCVLALFIGALASCQPTCEHTFSDKWYNDANNHWHPATCEHGEQKGDLAPHVDADEDGVCDVCELEIGHTHSLEADWSFDETHHWKNATCSHSDYKGENSLHSDENADGHCDVCTTHVHGVNAAGFCTFEECGKKIVDIDESDLEVLVNALAAQMGLVNSGEMDYVFTGRSNRAEDGFSTTSERNGIYLFGNNGYAYNKVYTKTVATTTVESTIEGWYMPDGPETAFGMVSEDGGETFALDMADADKLTGLYIALSGLADGYGPEGLLLSIYDSSAGVGDGNITVKDLEIKSYPDENKIEFSYTAVLVQATNIIVGENAGELVYNVNVYNAECSFTYTDDYALTSLDVKLDCFTSDPGALPSGALNEADVDLDYDPDTDTYTFRDTALADTYELSFTQTVGERTEENPNPKSKFVPTDFNLYFTIDETTGALSNKFTGANISADVYDIIKLYLGDYTPAGTSAHYVPELVTFKLFKDGAEIVDAQNYDNTTAVAMFTFSGEQRSFFVIPKEDGAYRLEIYLSGEKLYDVNMLVGLVEDDNIQLKDNEFTVKVSDTYEWANEVSFTAKEAGTYYFNLPPCIGFIDADGYDAAEKTPATDDTPNPYFDYNDAKNPDGSYKAGSFSLTLEAGETVRFYVNAMKRGTYVISYYVF